MGLGERIKQARDRAGIKQGDLAGRLGIALPTLSKYENGHRIPDAELLAVMASILNCDPGWLLTGSGSYPEADKQSQEGVAERKTDYQNYVFIPQMVGKISAGGGLVPDDTIEMKIAFRRDWITRRGDPKNMSLIRIAGDSMEPTLLSGDLVLVDHGRNYVDPYGGLYAIAFDHSIMIKRIQLIHTTGRLRIISDNPKYQPIEADPTEIKVNGKVIWFGREIER